MVGQTLGLPTSMGLYAFIGVAVTSATIVIYGEAIWDPMKLLARFENPVVVVIAMLALAAATLSTNVAANVVSPANDFSHVWPKRISFRTGYDIYAGQPYFFNEERFVILDLGADPDGGGDIDPVPTTTARLPREVIAEAFRPLEVHVVQLRAGPVGVEVHQHADALRLPTLDVELARAQQGDVAESQRRGRQHAA